MYDWSDAALALQSGTLGSESPGAASACVDDKRWTICHTYDFDKMPRRPCRRRRADVAADELAHGTPLKCILPEWSITPANQGVPRVPGCRGRAT